MRFSRFATGTVALVLVMLSGCAVNRATATVDPGANLATIKRIQVVHVAEDERRIDKLIAEQLNRMGFVATAGDPPSKDVDAVVTYVDRWMWDITMYMLDLTIVVRDPKTDFPMATGNSRHTSLTRKSPQEMVDEVTHNIFKDVKK
jgi:hypothetical protein